MPRVNGKDFPYKAGVDAAKKKKSKPKRKSGY